MKIVIMVCRIMLLVIMTGTYNICHSQYNATTSDLDKNWIVTKTVARDETVKGIGKQYFDNNGNTTQGQSKNMTTGQVLASQVINDALGRPVVSTMTAPVNNVNFGYKTNFVLNGTGTNYSYQNFDDVKTNNPDAIGGQNVPGTLGWYYSDNNTMETRVATSSFPYSRSEFYKDGTGSAKRSAGIGDTYRMGQGREISSFITPVINELTHYYQVRNKYYSTSELGEMPQNTIKGGIQSVAKDVNGKEVVSIADADGKTLMTARPGNELTVVNNVTLDGLNHQITMPLVPTGSGCTLGDQPVYITGSGKQFVLTNPGNVTITLQGPLENYSVPFSSWTDWGTVIKSDEPFRVLYSDRQGAQCTYVPTVLESQQIAPGLISVSYFKILADNTTVSITGNYTLYDMATEQTTNLINGNKLNRGYYKLVANSGTVNLSYSNSYGEISYNIYNQLGQLVSTIDPEGVKRLIQNINAYPTRADVPFISTVEYDTRGRMIASTSTEGDRGEFIYRRDGKLRFSQNAQQQIFGWFSYTNYDKSARAIETGEYHPNGDVTFAGLKTNTAILEDVTVTGGLPNTTNKYDWVKTKYDMEDNGYVGNVPGNYIQTFLRGGVSMLEAQESKTWYSYDFANRSAWVIKWINGLGYKTTDYVYDDEGRTSKVIYQKNTAAETFVHFYEYDADGRLSKVYTNTTDNSATKILQANYSYYLHGPVKRVETAVNLQGMDYTYTLDGKLKAVNHSDKTKDPGNDDPSTNGFLADAFGMTLEYYNNDYIRTGTNISSISINNADAPEQFGGQIRGMTWFSNKPIASGVSNDPTAYVYKYDALYQFAEATWGMLSGNNFVPQPGVNKETISGYDLHGNIQNLSRTNAGGSTTDNFLYNYIQSPKLTNMLGSITQQTTNNNYATYQYDNLGQLKAELPGPAYGSTVSKYLQYSVSGKVQAVYTNAGQTDPMVKYVYDELGKRIKKLSYNSSAVLLSTTYYVYDGSGSVMSIYEQPNGGSIEQKEIPIYSGGERAAIYFRQTDAYRYELTDHLGNVRAVFVKTVTNSISMVVFRDYYPFGMAIPGREYTDATGYRYGYQGEYSEKDPETGWNAFELRMYDSRIGRWMSVDPKGEFLSPYVGMGNDPIKTTDPDGGSTDDIIIRGKNGKTVTIVTTIIEKIIDVPFNIPENRQIVWSDLPKYADPSRLAIGYTYGLSADIAIGKGNHYSANLTYVKFLNEDYGKYWYVYAGYGSTTSKGFQLSGAINGDASFFIAYNTQSPRTLDYNPKTFEGKTTVGGVSWNRAAGLGGGFTASHFSMTSGWIGLSIGVSLTLGVNMQSFNRGSVFEVTSHSVLLNNVKKTADRGGFDKWTNRNITLVSSLWQFGKRKLF